MNSEEFCPAPVRFLAVEKSVRSPPERLRWTAQSAKENQRDCRMASGEPVSEPAHSWCYRQELRDSRYCARDVQARRWRWAASGAGRF